MPKLDSVLGGWLGRKLKIRPARYEAEFTHWYCSKCLDGGRVVMREGNDLTRPCVFCRGTRFHAQKGSHG